jgi:hypothetical protein
MKTNQTYWALSLATAIAVAGLSLGALSFAQAVTPLACSTSAASVNANQAAVVTATGGNGTYFWTGTNLNVTNSAGNRFAVSYPNAGVYAITVTSAGQSATCNITVAGVASTGSLSCSPVVQNVTLGQVATVSATGGNNAYVWSSPDLTITNPTGTGFSANYGSIGLKTLTVTSAGLTSTCAINVLSNGTVIPPVVTPGLPDTGGGYGQQ